jgi:hypothetical protein
MPREDVRNANNGFHQGASSFAAPIRAMPLVDPSESFDVAARHLFRHFADARRLSRNPLVRRFFEAGESQRLPQATERAALSPLPFDFAPAARRSGREHARKLILSDAEFVEVESKGSE